MSSRPAVAALWPALVAIALAAILGWCAMRSPAPPLPPPDRRSPGPGMPAEIGPPPAQPLRIIGLEQRNFGGELVPLGGTAPGGIVAIARLAGDTSVASVDIEIKPADHEFDGADARPSALAGKHVAQDRIDLPEGGYRWRARVRSETLEGEWIPFDPAAGPHVVIVAPVSTTTDTPPPPESSHGGRGAADATSSGGGEGMEHAHPSDMQSPASLWTAILPIAVSVIAIAAAAAGLWLGWRVLRRRRETPGGAS